jgi:Bacterial PH domain
MSQISKEAVAGVWPIELGEAFITQTFPSISSTAFGRLLGRVYGLPFPVGFLIHIGTVLLPVLTALGMYVFTRFRRYRLTSLRVYVRRGIRGKDEVEVKLENLDDVRIVVRPGQEFYRAGDLELVSRGEVALTLVGVPTAETFQHNILEARAAFVQVEQVNKARKQAEEASPAPTS